MTLRGNRPRVVYQRVYFSIRRQGLEGQELAVGHDHVLVVPGEPLLSSLLLSSLELSDATIYEP